MIVPLSYLILEHDEQGSLSFCGTENTLFSLARLGEI
jgi:hypothetical protein